jgi:hypothetical protein
MDGEAMVIADGMLNGQRCDVAMFVMTTRRISNDGENFSPSILSINRARRISPTSIALLQR